MDRIDGIERIERNADRATPIDGTTRNARTDPDGSRRDHPAGEDPGPRRNRPRPPAPAPPDDGQPHVDVRA